MRTATALGLGLALLASGCGSDSDGSGESGNDLGGGDTSVGGDATDGSGEDVQIASGLVVNEIVAASASGGADWIELYNPTDADISLDGWRITDKLKDDPGVWAQLPSDKTVPAGGFLVLYGPEEGAPEPGDFPFGVGLNDDLRLSAPSGEVADTVSWFAGQAAIGWSFGRFPDGGPFRTLHIPTPGAPNQGPTTGGTAPQGGEVVITEILVDAAAVKDADGEWFEVQNVSGAPVDINGWMVSDASGNGHVITNGGPLVIAPGELALLAAEDDPSKNGGITPNYAYSGVSLGNEIDSIVLIGHGVLVDRVIWDFALWSLVSGASLSLDPDANDMDANDDRLNWCSGNQKYGDGDHGTPGTPNPACP
jgi:hypothetical protein